MIKYDIELRDKFYSFHRVITIGGLVEGLDKGRIVLFPSLKEWSRERQSHLIESILYRIPLSMFYVQMDKVGKWHVIDGNAKLLAI